MFCPKCGAQAPDESAFCPKCGAGLHSAEAQQPRPAAPPDRPVPPAPPASPPPPTPPAAGTAGTLYPKGPLGARLLALIADSIIAAALLPLGVLLLYASAIRGEPPLLGIMLASIGGIWQLAYTLGRDVFGGAGFGKRLTGLVVTSVESGSIASAGATVLRQIVLLALGLIPAVGGLIEPIVVLVDKDGRRLGDKAAKTHVAKASDVAARGVPIKQGKGAAVAVLIAALAVSMIGSVVGGVALAQAVSQVDDWQFEIDESWDLDLDGESSTDVPAEKPGDLDEADIEEPGVEQPVDIVNAETATHAVGEMLYALMNDDVERARSFTTRNFQSEYDWFLYPASEALYRFEVIEVFPDPPAYGVRVREEWNSGPEDVFYSVVEEDGEARVDMVVWENL